MPNEKDKIFIVPKNSIESVEISKMLKDNGYDVLDVNQYYHPTLTGIENSADNEKLYEFLRRNADTIANNFIDNLDIPLEEFLKSEPFSTSYNFKKTSTNAYELLDSVTNASNAMSQSDLLYILNEENCTDYDKISETIDKYYEEYGDSYNLPHIRYGKTEDGFWVHYSTASYMNDVSFEKKGEEFILSYTADSHNSIENSSIVDSCISEGFDFFPTLSQIIDNAICKRVEFMLNEEKLKNGTLGKEVMPLYSVEWRDTDTNRPYVYSSHIDADNRFAKQIAGTSLEYAVQIKKVAQKHLNSYEKNPPFIPTGSYEFNEGVYSSEDNYYQNRLQEIKDSLNEIIEYCDEKIIEYEKNGNPIQNEEKTELVTVEVIGALDYSKPNLTTSISSFSSCFLVSEEMDYYFDITRNNPQTNLEIIANMIGVELNTYQKFVVQQTKGEDLYEFGKELGLSDKETQEMIDLIHDKEDKLDAELQMSDIDPSNEYENTKYEVNKLTNALEHSNKNAVNIASSFDAEIQIDNKLYTKNSIISSGCLTYIANKENINMSEVLHQELQRNYIDSINTDIVQKYIQSNPDLLSENNDLCEIIYIDNCLVKVNAKGYIPDHFIIKDGTERILREAFKRERLEFYSPIDITFPDSLKEICDYAFFGRNIGNIAFSEGLENIGVSAFYSCGIKNISIPNSVKIIGDCAFGNCDFENLTIGDNVEAIGFAAFKSNNITHLSIPKNVKFIADQAFNLSRCLESVTFEGNPELGEHIFESCRNLKTMIVRNEEMKQHLIDTKNVPEGCEIKVVEKEVNKTTAIGKLVDTNNTKEFTAGDEVLNKQEQLSVPVAPSGEDISHDDDNHDEF